jgi:hypothetical protein
MKQEILFSMKSPYRDEFKIQGFRFGEGEKSVAIVGAMRGDEVQQQFTCSQIVKNLMEMEEAGLLVPGHEILVIPSANHFSMNINKRFWAMDNTDINRMFPGYEKGETTQRIASAVFDSVKGYKYGIQLASFYLPGEFIPHVRMMNTGFQDTNLALKFGLPYVFVHYSTTTGKYLIRKHSLFTPATRILSTKNLQKLHGLPSFVFSTRWVLSSILSTMDFAPVLFRRKTYNRSCPTPLVYCIA